MASTQSVIDRVVDLANDPNQKQLRLADIARWGREAIKLIANGSARAAGKYSVITLAAGTRQDLRTISPTTQWIRLHEVVCNAPSGTPSGDVINRVDRTALDAAVRNWRGAAAATTILEFSQDERDAYTFDVFPPAQAGTQVQVYASVYPADAFVLASGQTALVNPAETIPLAEGYDIAVVDYIMARYYQRNTESQTAAARAKQHADLFVAESGLLAQAAKAP